MNSIPIMIFLWRLGLTLGEAAGYMNDIGPGVLLAPVKGLGTGYQYVRAAQGAMEKSVKKKESALLKKKESIQAGKQSLIKL